MQLNTDITDMKSGVEEANAGPLSCVICNSQGCLATTITCECCDQSFHLSCYGVGEEDHQSVSKFIAIIGWTCQLCREESHNQLQQLKKELLNLSSKLDQLTKSSERTTSSIASHQQAAGTAGTQDPQLIAAGQSNAPNEQLSYASVVSLVRKSVKEVNMKKTNVIVSGLIEREGGDESGMFSKLCEEELGVKPLIQHDGTRRLGKEIGAGPRKLLVSLASEASARELVQLSRKLRKSKDPYVASKVYINPDLTKEESKQAYLKRELRRNTTASASLVLEAGQSSTQGATTASTVKSSSLTFTNSTRKIQTLSSHSSNVERNTATTTVTSNSTPLVTPVTSNSRNATTLSTSNQSGLNPSAVAFSQSPGLSVGSSSIVMPSAIDSSSHAVSST